MTRLMTKRGANFANIILIVCIQVKKKYQKNILLNANHIILI